MKYKSEKTLRRAKKAFSLIELMIVIVIIGALTAIILPQFDISEAEAKDAGCDASNYGTLAQLTKFRSLHGVYPSGLHTGYEAAASTTGGATGNLMGNTNTAAIPSFTALNMATGSGDGTGQSTMLNINSNVGLVASLREAGIISLACGGFPSSTTTVDMAYVGVNSSSSSSSAVTLNVSVITSDWYEEWSLNDNGTADTTELNTASDSITINGIPLYYYSYVNPRQALADGASAMPTTTGDVAYTDDEISDHNETEGNTDNQLSAGDTWENDDQNGVVIPLFIAPTVIWDTWYDSNGSANEAKIGVAQTGACPWLEANADFRYYMAVFKVFFDGSKATLIGTMCPEGGSINP